MFLDLVNVETDLIPDVTEVTERYRNPGYVIFGKTYGDRDIVFKC